MDSDKPKVTYPPEMLPKAEEGDEIEVFVEHPDTKRHRLVFSSGPAKLQLDCDEIEPVKTA
jgi:hypothetical protein